MVLEQRGGLLHLVGGQDVALRGDGLRGDGL